MTQRNLLLISAAVLFVGVFCPLVNLGQYGSVSALARLGWFLLIPCALLVAAWVFAPGFKDWIVCSFGAASVLFWLHQVYSIHSKASALSLDYTVTAGVGVGWGAALLLGSGLLVFIAGRIDE